MKSLRRMLIILALGYVSGAPVHAQCISVSAIYQKLIEGNETLDDRALLNLCIGLKKQYIQCGYKSDSVLAKINHLTGRSYWQLDSLLLGKKFTEEAIKLNASGSRSARLQDCANSYINLIGISRALNEVGNAEKAFKEGVKIAAQSPGKIYLLPEFYQTMANLQYDLGEYQKSIEFSEIGERLSVEQGDIILEIKNKFEKIQALMAMKRSREAFVLLQQTNKTVVKIKDHKTKGLIMAHMGNLYSARKESVLAISLSEKSIQEFKEHLKINSTDSDVLFNIAVAYNNIGDTFLNETKEYSKALLNYRQALKYINEDLARARILGNIAAAYGKMNAYDKALNAYNEVFRKITLGSIKITQGHNPTAEAIRNVSAKLYMLTLIRDKANTWLDYAKHVKGNRNQLLGALNTYMLADTMIDYMRWEHSAIATKLFWRDQTHSLYERAIETCYLLNDPEKAFHFFEKSRTVMLNDQLNELGANQKLDRKDAEKEKSIRQNIAVLQDKLRESKPGSAGYVRISDALFAVQAEQQEFIHNLEKENPQYYSYKYDNTVPTIREIRSRVIPEGQTFMSYFVGDSAVYGLSITSDAISLKKINVSDYQKQTADFQLFSGNREMQNKQFAKYLIVSNKLYELLIKPFNIQSHRIIVSPDGNFLPFENLSFSPSKAEFLVKRYAFSYTYSAGFLTKSKRTKSGFFAVNTFLGMAPVKFSPELKQASLPGSEISLEAISKHFYLSKILTESSASRQAFLEELSDHRIIQLLTHASADSLGTEPVLYFADSTLKLSELRNTEVSKTQLMVLSACRTGIGKNQKGEGVFSLARGFAGIGIPSVLTTLWSVENKAVYGLTALFYSELETGVPLDVALQKAQVQWLNSAAKADQLPYSWAGMVLIGNTHAVETGLPKKVADTVMAGVAGLLLLLALFPRQQIKTQTS